MRAERPHRLTVRKLLPVALAGTALAIADVQGWIERTPLVLLLGAVVGAILASELAAVALPPSGSAVRRHAAIAAQLAGVTVAIYLTGWGPVLTVGYLYSVVDAFRKHGSRAQTPLLVWLVVFIGASQLSIAMGLAPSLIDGGAAQGIAALSAIALLVAVEFLGAVTRARETDEARFRALVQHSSDAITIVAPDGRITYASPAATRLLGHAPDDLVGSAAWDLIYDDDAHIGDEVLARVLGARGRAVEGELRLVRADGRPRRVEFTATNLLDDPAVHGIVANVRDISGRAATQRPIEEESRDSLTGLATRSFFEARLQLVAERMGVAAEKFAIVVVDIDRFDFVNTSAGEEAGDTVLECVAGRLVGCVRPGDVVARLGDDEFAVLICDVLGPDDAVAVAGRVTAALRDPLPVGDGDLVLTASVGIALCQPGLEAREVLRQAQLAVRAAKQRGGDRFELFDARLAGTFRRRLDLGSELARAIEREEFVVYYQPVVAARAAVVTGFEALVRWHHPTRGMLLPLEFIPLAEENGTIELLGAWVLEEACRQAASWAACELRGPDIHVNLSGRQVTNRSLAGYVDSVLGEAGLDADRLVLEITETVLMDDIDASVTAIESVRETGVRFAIDDFGAGYSSFAYLTRLPIQMLKLDHSLIDRLADQRDVAVVETIVNLAHRMGLIALAEGVERKEQLDVVTRAGCDLFQGFCFERPLPPDRATALLSG